jgi:hypothetical protein
MFRVKATLTAAFLLVLLLIARTNTVQAQPTSEKNSASSTSTSSPAEPNASPTTQSTKTEVPTLSGREKREIKLNQANTWQLSIQLDMPNLVPQAVLYALFDKDPVPGFIARVKRMPGLNREQLDKADTQARARMDQWHFIQMGVRWDIGFSEITGDKVNLLTQTPERRYTSIISTTPAGRKWIVTKVVRLKGKTVCWCIAVEVKIGSRVNVVLNDSNTLDLQRLYDDAMGKPK